MRNIPIVAAIAVTGAVALLHGRSEQANGLHVTALPSPAPAGSAQPQLTVSPRGVLLSWIERAGDEASLRFAERTASGWTEARTVASGKDWFVNWADVPSVVRLDDGTVYGHWLQKSGSGTYAYDVRLARSTDDGRTWTPSFTPHHDGTQTEHGFASLFQMPGAGLGLVWLDGRAMKGGDHEGHGGGGGAMSVRAATFDARGTQTGETAVDLRVCECCPTAAAVTADGPIVAYRDRSEGEIRDIYISRLTGGTWSEPAPVHRDNWKIAACPVNGPALSANGRNVAIAWFTAQGDEGHVFAAFSADAGPHLRHADSPGRGRRARPRRCHADGRRGRGRDLDRVCERQSRIQDAAGDGERRAVGGDADLGVGLQSRQRLSAHGGAWARTRVCVDRSGTTVAGQDGGGGVALT